MALSEFELIRRFFQRPGLMQGQAALVLGIGDDCALLQVPAGQELAVSMDMLLAEVHFPRQAPADLLARRAVAVNLSDLAAMGAEPLGMTLGLSLPQADETWLEAFSQGLEQAVQTWACPLMGGDITRGSLVLALQVHGSVPAGQAIRRSMALPGDKLYVSGTLGAAGLALRLFDGTLNIQAADAVRLEQAYYLPEPRLALGRAARGLVSAGIDISDGLLADAAHIARQSGVAIRIDAAAVPVATVVTRVLEANGRSGEALDYALSAGDDYELLLTVPPTNESLLLERAAELGINLSCIGEVHSGQGVECLTEDGSPVQIFRQGYRHFG